MKTASMKTPGPKSVLFGILAAVVRTENAQILAAQAAREAGEPVPALTHCPLCGDRLGRVYETFGTFLECGGEECYFTASAPAMVVLEAN